MSRLPFIGLAAAIVAIALIPTSPVAAIDSATPTPTCAGLAFKDPAGDHTGNALAPDATTSTDMIGGFLKYEPDKAADALTYNIQVKELKAEVPVTSTTISWNAYYDTGDGTLKFVRAILDFSGAIAFEYGVFTPTGLPAGPTGTSQVAGTTTGKLFEGAPGVVQLVVPSIKAGQQLKSLYASTGQGRTAPAATPGGQRGLSGVPDTAPDAGAEAGGKYAVAACAAAPAATAKPPLGTIAKPVQGTGPAKLPVKLVSSSVKAPKAKKLSLKLSSSAKVTKLAAQLVKGKKVVGKGTLATLSGNGTLQLKLSSKAAKGTYRLDLAGTLASGQRGVSSYTLKLK